MSPLEALEMLKMALVVAGLQRTPNVVDAVAVLEKALKEPNAEEK